MGFHSPLIRPAIYWGVNVPQRGGYLRFPWIQPILGTSGVDSMFSAIAMATFLTARNGGKEWPWQIWGQVLKRSLWKKQLFFCKLPNSIPLQKRRFSSSSGVSPPLQMFGFKKLDIFWEKLHHPKTTRCKPKTRGFLFVETLFLFTFGVNISPSLAAVRFRNLYPE